MRLRLWIQGARLRTLPASLAPVVIGACCAWRSSSTDSGAGLRAAGRWLVPFGVAPARGSARWWAIVLLCACVALFLQIAVNYANDYSDGIRGTDNARGSSEAVTGLPTRLTASGLVSPRAVLLMAGFWAFAACVAGFALAILSGHLWFIAVGALCLAAAWFYTGGHHPYGYAGLGEAAVFLFFGIVAVLGTEYAAAGSLNWTGFVGACAVGLDSAAILIVNNIRDISGDAQSGKNTLEVRLGEQGSHCLLAAVFAGALVLSFFSVFLLIGTPDSSRTYPWWIFAAWALAAVPALASYRASAQGRHKPALMLASAAVLALALLVCCTLYT